MLQVFVGERFGEVSKGSLAEGSLTAGQVCCPNHLRDSALPYSTRVARRLSAQGAGIYNGKIV